MSDTPIKTITLLRYFRDDLPDDSSFPPEFRDDARKIWRFAEARSGKQEADITIEDLRAAAAELAAKGTS